MTDDRASAPETPPGPPGVGRGVLGSMRWNTAGRFAQQGIRMLLAVVVARVLTPEEFGLMGMAYVVAGLLQIFVDFGTGYAVIQQREVDDRLLSSVFYLNLMIGCSISLVMFLGADALAAAFAEPQVTPVLRVFSGIFLMTSPALLHQALLMREMRFDRMVQANVAGVAAEATVAISLAYSGFGVWSLLAGAYVGAIVTIPLLWSAARWRPRAHFAWDDIRGIARYSLNLWGSDTYQYLATQADRVIISRFLGASPLGLYAMAQRFTTTSVKPVTGALDPVLFAHLSRNQEDPERMRAAFLRTNVGLALVFVPAMIGLAVVADPFVRTLFSDEWLPLVPLIAILAPAGVVNALVERVQPIYSATGRTDLLFRWGVVRGVVLALSFLVGVPWGLVGVAASFGIASLLLAPPTFWIPFRLIGLGLGRYLASLAPVAIGTLVMAVGAEAARLGAESLGWIAPAVLVAAIAGGVVCYGAVLLVLRPPALGDLLTAIDLRRSGVREESPPVGP